MKNYTLLFSLFFFVSVFEMQSYAQVGPQPTNVVVDDGISRSRYVTGGVLGSVFGFGIGHAVQERYAEKGWIFTAGDAAGVLLIANANCFRGRNSNSQDRAERERSDCENPSQAILGVSLFLASHVWEIVDLWAVGKNYVRKDPSETSLFLLPGDQKGTLVYSFTF